MENMQMEYDNGMLSKKYTTYYVVLGQNDIGSIKILKKNALKSRT